VRPADSSTAVPAIFVATLTLGGGTLTTIASNVQATRVAVDSTAVYWVEDEGPTGPVMKVAKP
jgi:hypothetical protein